MLVYRIASHQYSKDIKGIGAGLYGGRWNPIGTPLLYTAEHRSLALCEMMVNLDTIQIKQDYDLITISVPDKLIIKKITKKQLPNDWNERRVLPNTQLVGKQFVTGNKSVGLAVPSVIIPEERNFLFNPLHEDFTKIKIVDRKPFIFDERLF
jgi:RES domain-containing protein